MSRRIFYNDDQNIGVITFIYLIVIQTSFVNLFKVFAKGVTVTVVFDLEIIINMLFLEIHATEARRCGSRNLESFSNRASIRARVARI